jgi:hypothetical protein
MNIGRRTTVMLLGVIVLFSLILRYPRSGHEVGVDSFFVHVLAQSIVADGHAEWIVSPFSYFGWYPLSYPSAGPFLLASTTALTGTSLEGSILLIAMLLGPIGILGAFLMAREFRSESAFALVVAFLYGVAPRFLAFTLWSASTRSLFMALLPIFIWSLIAHYRRRSIARYLILTTSFTLLAATHRLSVLLSVVFLAFLVAAIAQVILRILRIYFPRIVLHNSFRKAAPHLALVAIVLIAAAMLLGSNVLGEYTKGELASGTEPQIQILNLIVSIARSSGIALPLTFVGIVVVTRQRNKTIREPFLAFAFLGLIPTLLLREYAGFYVLPLLTLLGGLGFRGLVALFRKRPRLLKTVAAVLVLVIAGFSTFVLNVEVSRSTYISPEVYDASQYSRLLAGSDTFVSNDGLTGIQFAAVSGVHILPVGGAGTTFQSPELLAYRFYSEAEVSAKLVRLSILDITIDSDSIWIVPDVQAERDWVQIMQSPNGAIPQPLATRYAPSYLLELRTAPGQFLAFDNVYCSELGLWANADAYRVFENSKETIWWIRAPPLASSLPTGPGRCR